MREDTGPAPAAGWPGRTRPPSSAVSRPDWSAKRACPLPASETLRSMGRVIPPPRLVPAFPLLFLFLLAGGIAPRAPGNGRPASADGERGAVRAAESRTGAPSVARLPIRPLASAAGLTAGGAARPGNGVPGTAVAQPFLVEELDPFRVTQATAATVRVRGVGMDRVASAQLWDMATGAVTVLNGSLSGPNEVRLTIPAGQAPGSYYLVLLAAAPSPGLWASAFFVDPPLPQVASVQPGSVASDAGGAVTIAGTGLATASKVLLEATDGRFVGLSGLQVQGPGSLTAQVPTELEPGSWRVRVVTAGGMSLGAVALNVLADPTPPPEVRAASALEVDGTSATAVTLDGAHLAGASAVSLHGDLQLALPFTVVSPTRISATVPAGTPPDVYDWIVQTPAGANAASAVKLVVVDPATAVDWLGDGTALGVTPDTVRFATPRLHAVVERGRLRFLHDRLLGRPRLSDGGLGDGDLGLEWEAQVPGALVGHASTGFAGVGVDGGTIRFPFTYQGQPLFEVRWRLAGTGDALELDLAWDADLPGLPGNVLAADLGSFGVPPGLAHVAAAHGGVRLDALTLAEFRTLRHPEHYDAALFFLEDPLGGGLLVDATALEDAAGLRGLHRRDLAPGTTRFHLRATPSRDRLVTGALGPVRFALASGDWSDAVEPLQAAVANPLRPQWMDRIASVFRVIGLDPFGDPAFAPEVVESIYADVGVALPSNFRLLHAVAAHDEGLAGTPDWTPSVVFRALARGLSDRGWHVVPYVPTPGLQDDHPQYASWSAFRLGRWDKPSQAIRRRFWDANQSGSCCDDPEDYWLLNVGHRPYRDFVRAELGSALGTGLALDGAYLDFMKPNARADDRDPGNPDAREGYRDLVQELVQDFGPSFAVAGEDSSVFLSEAGNSLAAIHVIEPGALERDPTGGGVPLGHAHPIGTHLVADVTALSATSELAMPGWHPAQFHVARWASAVQGALPTAAVIGFAGWLPVSLHPEPRRALVQVAEEGVYWRVHGVRPWTDPHPAWTDPTTLRVYEIDGQPVVRTRDWYVKKVVCDLFWQFGGRGPTPAELAALATTTHCTPVGLYAATCDVRERFRQSPTPPAAVRTRAEARAEILQVFPAYPAP